MAALSSIPAWRIQQTEELAGYSPWGRAEWHTPEGTEQVVGTTQRTWCKVMFELLCVCVKQLEGWAGPSILLLS